MNLSYFLNHLTARQALDAPCQAELKSRVKERTVAQGATLHYPEQAVKHLYFIRSGFFRCYQMIDELEQTTNFACAGHFTATVVGFFSQQLHQEGIKCEKEGIVLQISYYDWLALEDFSPAFIRLGKAILLEQLMALRHQNNLYRNSNATQRYLQLCQQHPGIANLVSHKNIAAYLGITPPTLSNLLKDLLRNDK